MDTKTVLAFLIGTLICISANAIQSGQQLMNKAFSIEKINQFPIPEEMVARAEVVKFLGHVEAVNHFPYGKDQIAYVRNSKIKSVVVNFRAVKSSGVVDNSISKTVQVAFSREGLVQQMLMSVSGRKIRSAEYVYDDGLISTLKLNDFSNDRVNADIFTLSVGNNISFRKERILNSRSTIAQDIRLTDNWRVIYMQPGYGSLDTTFVYADSNALKKVEIRKQMNSNIYNITNSIVYEQKYPAASARESISGGSPYDYTHGFQPCTFNRNENTIFQICDQKNFATGQITSATEFNYSFNSNQIIGIKIVKNWQIGYDSGNNLIEIRDQAAPSQSYDGFAIKEVDGKVSNLFLGVVGSSSDLLLGTITYKYRPDSKIPYRAEFTYRTTHLFYATVDSELTDYYED